MADLVEVIRCKDCAWRHTADCYLSETEVGDELDNYAPIVVDDYTEDDFFCADGEPLTTTIKGDDNMCIDDMIVLVEEMQAELVAHEAESLEETITQTSCRLHLLTLKMDLEKLKGIINGR